ncbi:hypothetical protein ACWGJP_01540 [Microbacterium sp. NPDC055903]
MDPVLLEFWWALPAAAAAGAAGVWAVRRRGSERRIGYDAATLELREAVSEATAAQQAVRVARAEVARAVAERAASRVSADDVARARRTLQTGQREAKAAAAKVRHLRARVATERAAIPSRAEPTPVARLRTAHDTVLVRWMRYETDPGLQIAYPAMSDAHAPATAAFLTAVETAQRARPTEDGTTPQEYIAYRDAVQRLQSAFDEAERHARLAAGEKPDPAAWQDAAQQVITLSADVIERAAAAAASALAALSRRDRPGR